jgi:import receptor subunit TOM70
MHLSIMEVKMLMRSYTKAIEVSIRKDPVFFSNRAACKLSSSVPWFLADVVGYTNFSPPQYQKCVADCDEALKLDRQ